MKKVTAAKVTITGEGAEGPLPPQIQEALGELAEAAREGLLALSVGVGLGVVHELMGAEVDEVVGPKARHDERRSAHRHGHEDGSMTLGGRRLGVRRPRVRSADGEHEISLQTYEHFADRDPLTRAVMNRMLAGVSTRRYASVGEPVGAEVEEGASSTSRSAVSRAFVERTRTALGELMSRRLDDIRLAAMMIDGLEIAGRCHVVALGITTDGQKIPLGLWGLDRERDARRRAARRSRRSRPRPRAGDPVRDRRLEGTQEGDPRCLRIGRAGSSLPSPQGRNVLDQLPEGDRPALRARLRAAWALEDAGLARQRLELVAAELGATWPDAARSLREGLEETLTLMRLGITGQLAKTLSSTNPCGR